MIQIFFFECHSKILKNYYNFLSFKRTKHINRFHAPFPLPLNVSKSSKQIHIYTQCLDITISMWFRCMKKYIGFQLCYSDV